MWLKISKPGEVLEGAFRHSMHHFFCPFQWLLLLLISKHRIPGYIWTIMESSCAATIPGVDTAENNAFSSRTYPASKKKKKPS